MKENIFRRISTQTHKLNLCMVRPVHATTSTDKQNNTNSVHVIALQPETKGRKTFNPELPSAQSVNLQIMELIYMIYLLK